jgi:hypothetical protein
VDADEEGEGDDDDAEDRQAARHIKRRRVRPVTVPRMAFLLVAWICAKPDPDRVVPTLGQVRRKYPRM